MRLTTFALLVTLSGDAGEAHATSQRSDALLQAVAQGGLQLDGTGLSFNVVLGENAPYLPAVVASKGADHRTFVVPRESRQMGCELEGTPFGKEVYREHGTRRLLSISELEADAQELRALSSIPLRHCKSGIRRCARDPNLCVMILTEVRGGYVVTSDGRHASAERIDQWFDSALEHELTPDLIGAVSKALYVQNAKIVGIGRYGVTVETATGDWLFFLAGETSAQGLPLRDIPGAVREIRTRAAGRDPAIVKRTVAVTDGDVRNIYVTAGFDTPSWRDFLRAHPALVLDRLEHGVSE